MVICLELGAYLHMAQLMPLPLTVSCFSKIRIGFTFLIPAHPNSRGQRAVKQVCACACDLSDTVTKITVSVILSIICICCTLRMCCLCLIVYNVGTAMKIIQYWSEFQSSLTGNERSTGVKRRLSLFTLIGDVRHHKGG